MARKSCRKWYVFHVKKHKEQIVLRQLEARDDIEEVFFPTFRVSRRDPRSAPFRPCFPGYIFLRLDLDQCGENVVRWLPGVKDLVRFGEEAVSVPGEYIETLKIILDPGKAEAQLTQSPQMSTPFTGNGAGGESASWSAFTDAERVAALFSFLKQDV